MKPSNPIWALLGLGAALAACRQPARCPGDWCGTAVLYSAEPGVLLPAASETDVEEWIGQLIFSKLADLGPGLNTVGDSGFVPDLAERWVWDDPATLCFRLRPAHWHDGLPVTAADVAFSFDLYRDSVVNARARPLLGRIASVTAVDSQVVVFRFRQPYPEAFFDAVYHVRILPRHLLDTVPRARLASHPFGRHPIGSGPFRFVRWTAGETIELAGDSSYYGGRPGLRRVIWRFVPDMEAAVAQLVAGELDGGSLLAPRELVDRIRRAPELRTIPYPVNAYSYIGFNLRDPADRRRPHPLFSDRELRRALSFAVDRAAVVQAVLGDLGEVPAGPLTSWLWIYSDSLRSLPFDTAAARQSFDRLGWRRGPDGIRRKAGRPLRFELLVPTTSLLRRRAAVIVQEQLKRAGVAVQLRELDFNTFIARARAGRFDAAFLSWVMDPSPRSIQQTWTSAGIGNSNFQGYSDPIFDRLVDQAIETADRRQAARLWHAAIDTINADAPAIWLFAPRALLAVHARFQQVTLRPDLWTAGLARWRVDPRHRLPRDLVVAP